MRELERKKQQMQDHIRALEDLLAENGIPVQKFVPSSSRPVRSAPPSFDSGEPSLDRESVDWSQTSVDWERGSPQGSDASKPYRFTRPKTETRPADRHLGVATDNPSVSSINGTRLSILGATIDITDFDAPDTEEPPPAASSDPNMARPLYNKTVQSLWQSIHRVNPTPKIKLPPRAEGLQYAEWYFNITSPFLPVLHRPTVMNMVYHLNLDL